MRRIFPAKPQQCPRIFWEKAVLAEGSTYPLAQQVSSIPLFPSPPSPITIQTFPPTRPYKQHAVLPSPLQFNTTSPRFSDAQRNHSDLKTQHYRYHASDWIGILPVVFEHDNYRANLLLKRRSFLATAFFLTSPHPSTNKNGHLSSPSRALASVIQHSTNPCRTSFLHDAHSYPTHSTNDCTFKTLVSPKRHQTDFNRNRFVRHAFNES